MWEQYVEKARLELAEAGERGLEIRFEELLQRPQKLIPTIARFCGVLMPDNAEDAFARIDASRALAYRQDPELLTFAESARAILDRHGYSP